MNLNKILLNRNGIYGVLALWIVFFHVYRRISMPFIPAVTNIVVLGNMAVELFMFFSGLCLCLEANRVKWDELGWKKYFTERFLRILPSYFIIAIPYYAWSSMFEHSGTTISKIELFIAHLSSATFWLRGTQTTWFAYGIMVFYLLFPLIYMFVKTKSRKQIVLLLTLLIFFALATSVLPVLKNSMIVWARLPIFTIGVIAGNNIEKINKSERYSSSLTIVAFAVLLALGAIVSMSEITGFVSIPQVLRFILYIPMTFAVLVLISRFGRKKEHKGFWFILGGASLEIYLVHITLLHPFKYYGLIDLLGFWLYLVLPIVAVIISLIIKRIEKRYYSNISVIVQSGIMSSKR